LYKGRQRGHIFWAHCEVELNTEFEL
jgi:hypothetical protein